MRNLKSVKGMALKNARPTIAGMALFNSSGDVDISSAGFQYAIDTLTFIRANIIKQVFFELSIADYLPVDVGEAAWRENIVQNLEFYEGGNFEDGLVAAAEAERTAKVDTALEQLTMPTRIWKKKASWNIAQIAQAANASNWDPVEAKLRSLKKNWDLGIQALAFNGLTGDSKITGFLNAADVNINTTLIPKALSAMSDTEFTTCIKGLLSDYYSNSNSTKLPDAFAIPTDDFLGLGSPYSATFPMISKLEYLEINLKKMTGNDGFKVLPLTYGMAANNPEAKDRYVLYRRDPEVLKLSIPVDLTMNQSFTFNGFDFEQLAYGQLSGVLVTRPREMRYLDKTTPST